MGNNGGNYILTKDVVFNDTSTQFIDARFDANGATTYYALKAYGQVQSGLFAVVEVDLTGEVLKGSKGFELEMTLLSRYFQ